MPRGDVFDYIIVGAGSAGCVLAHRLTEDPRVRVLLLEAGGPDRKPEIHIPLAFGKLFKSAYDWQYTTAAQPRLGGRELYWPRGKTLGGSSSISAQVHTRGNRADFDRWAGLGNPGWSYHDVLPVLRRSEHFEHGGDPAYHGKGGALNVTGLRRPNQLTHAFVHAAVAAGIPRNDDPNGATQDGVGHVQVTQKRGRRHSAADAYLKPARHRPNLTVRTGARVTRILVEGGRAAGVAYTRAGRAEIAAAREVLLAAGAVNSPQLLLLSGIGPALQLQKHGLPVVCDLPGVGRNLQDHCGVAVTVACTRPVSLAGADSLSNLARWLVARRGPLTSNAGEALAFVRSSPDLAAPDLELLFAPVAFLDHGFTVPPGHTLTLGVLLLEPRSVGSITLGATDPLAPPVIQPNYLSDPDAEDLRRLVWGVRLARRILATEPLAAYVGAPIEPSSRIHGDVAVAAFIREQAETIYHPVGTCKMGDDPMAVVDSQLRVRGIDGLRVIDASVMPTIVRGHTNAATVMIAEKAAAMLRATPPSQPATASSRQDRQRRPARTQL